MIFSSATRQLEKTPPGRQRHLGLGGCLNRSLSFLLLSLVASPSRRPVFESLSCWGRFAMAILTIAMLSGCGDGGDDSHLPQGASVLRIAEVDDVPTLDPAAGYDTESWTFEQALFDTLVRYADETTDLEPDLASSWESSLDARRFVFHLLHDTRFSSGRSVTSDDVRYGIERVLDPATRSRGIEYYRGIAGSETFAAHRAAHVSGIETPDAWTIVFNLDTAIHFRAEAGHALRVGSTRESSDGRRLPRHPIGSGAFMLKGVDRGERLCGDAQSHYFKPDCRISTRSSIHWESIESCNGCAMKRRPGCGHPHSGGRVPYVEDSAAPRPDPA